MAHVSLQLADPQKNHLLAALPQTIYLRWLPQLEAVEMPLGLVLYEANKVLGHVYFPTTAMWAAVPHPAAPWCKTAVRAFG